MRFGTIVALAVALVLCGPVRAPAGEPEPKHPVYVGVRVCASCHQGKGMGHPQCRWLLSKHSRAYASLAEPESKAIARLSGIPQEPQEAAVCLGCHATGAEAEDWEKDDTFHVEDGVQCEKCHGPGSEYMDEQVMRDRKAAMRAGLLMPTMDDCMACHRSKGSHVAVLKRPELDRAEAWKSIDHRMPRTRQRTPALGLPKPAAAGGPQPRYAGAMACARCHGGRGMGYQFSKWRLSAHARAYAALATPAAAAARKSHPLAASR